MHGRIRSIRTDRYCLQFMTIRIGINGFGRIGRLAFRQAMSSPDVEVVAINDLIQVDYLAYLLRYDSTHRRFPGDIQVDDGHLMVNGKPIRVTAERDPHQLHWDEVDVDYVLESSGLFLTAEKARAHLEAGAKRVVMSAPSKDDTPMFVMGVNPQLCRPRHCFQCKLHHQLPGPTGQGGQRQLRHRQWFDDNGACHHSNAKTHRQSLLEGLAWRPWRRAKHHPQLHGCSEGRGSRDPRAEWKAHRHGLPRADPRRIRGGPDRESGPAHEL